MPASSNIVTCGLPNTGSSLASALMVRSMHPPRAQTCRVHLERGAGVEQHGAAHGLAGRVLERKANQRLFATRDQKEGMQASIEKHKPKFEGR